MGLWKRHFRRFNISEKNFLEFIVILFFKNANIKIYTALGCMKCVVNLGYYIKKNFVKKYIFHFSYQEQAYEYIHATRLFENIS
jgi:hypothetical protein